ncbi:MAG: amidohydrolase family protein [Acidobacteria bacterium]|nr:amidohydrolase family protein [Acidobacteriota bacterium]
MKTKFLLLAFAAIVTILGNTVEAQSVAITNARIVTVSGSTIPSGSVVIRDGLIEAVGADVRIPADARIINGSGLTVYPGLFDAASTLGMPAPSGPQGQGGPGGGGGGAAAAAAAAARAGELEGISNYPVGLRPEFRAADVFKAGDSQFEAVRNAGITTAVVSGRTGIFTGASLVTNLAGDRVSAMIIRSPASQNFSYRTIGGGQYPASLLGTFSAFRQLLHDAKRQQDIERLHAADPRGLKRPESDPSLTALYPVINGQMPIVFNANTEREIVRSLDLAKEFKLKAVISGGHEAWKQAARLKEQNVPVLVSLNFPKGTAPTAPEADPDDLSTLKMRAETPKGPARLVQAGVKIAFQTGDLTNVNDIFTNLGYAIDDGLSADAALRAFTLSGAEIFGVDNVTGSVEKGKIANLVVTRGDVFAKERTVTHVIVDGNVFEQKERPAAQPGRGRGPQGPGQPAQPAAGSIGGTYTITIEIPGESMPATLVITPTGSTFTGQLRTAMGNSDVQNGKITGNAFSFTAVVPYGGVSLNIDVSGTVTGNAISGNINTDQGAVPFSGTKNP